MKRPSSKIIRRLGTCCGFFIVLLIAVVSIVNNSLTLQRRGSSPPSSSLSSSKSATATATATTTQQEANPPPVDGKNESLFHLPSTDEFRPVKSLSRTCTPDPSHNQQAMQSIQTFTEYSNSSVYFDTTTTFKKSNHKDNNHDDLLLICEFISKDNAMHFAHTMQQLYGCYSYWQTSLKENVQENRRRCRPVLIFPSYKVQTKLETNPFLKGYLQLLQDSSFGLEIITKNQYKEKYYINKNNSTTTNNHENQHIQTIDVSGGYILSHAKELNNLLLEYGREDNSSSNNALFSSLIQEQQQSDCVTSSSSSSRSTRIGILNRRASVGRSIVNVQKLVDTISESTKHTTVTVEYFEEKTFEEQIEFFANVDILISPHGAQLTGIPFMLLQQQRQQSSDSSSSYCSYLLEIFPKKYALPNFYGSLATNSGINYSYLYLSNQSYQDERQSETIAERIHARAQDLCPSPDMMLESIQSLIHTWEECMTFCNGQLREAT